MAECFSQCEMYACVAKLASCRCIPPCAVSKYLQSTSYTSNTDTENKRERTVIQFISNRFELSIMSSRLQEFPLEPSTP